jgi:uncharacterized protein (DUF433 family)
LTAGLTCFIGGFGVESLELRENIGKDAEMSNTAQMSWDECDLVERAPGKLAGKPVIKGTRVQPEIIVENYEGGSDIEEICENYPHVPLEAIRRVIEFHHAIS